MEICFNHPGKAARTRCKTCHRPICEECQKVTELGSFCSDACYEKARHFTERVSSIPPSPSRKGRFKRFLKRIVILAILLAALYVVLSIYYGEPTNFFDQLSTLFTILF
jgi:hypothetical protein